MVEPSGGGQSAGLNPALQAQLAQQMSSNAPKPTDIDSLKDQIVGSLANLFTFIGIKPDSFTQTGIFANVTPPQGIAEKPINQFASSLNARGGRLAEMLAMFKVYFSGISAQVGGGVDISPSNLISFSAPQFGAGVGGVGMGADFGVA